MQILHYNGHDGCTFIVVECMERRCVGVYEQQVRLYCWCVLEFEGVQSRMHEVVVLPSCGVKIHYKCTTMVMTAVCLSSLKCMERCCIGRVPTESTFVYCLYWWACVRLNFKGVIGVV